MKKIKFTLALIMAFFLGMLSSCSFSSSNENIHTTMPTYVIDNDYFTYKGCEKIKRLDNDERFIMVKAECNCFLTEVSMEAELYNENNVFLTTVQDSKEAFINPYTEICLYGSVSETIQLSTRFIKITFSGLSIFEPDPSTKKFTVTFVYNNGQSNTTKTVQNGKTVSKPDNPTKENYIFSMWCLDPDLKNEYDFSKGVTSNLTLYAKYIVDFAALTNKVTATIMKANVTVYTKSYNTFLGITTETTTKSGSGIIFYQSTNYYYLITNNHVVVKTSSYSNVSYTIEDYKGNTYTGTVVDMKASYDLAVLYFKKGSVTLNAVSRSAYDPNVGDDIISVGQPKGQNNAISYGKFLSYVSAPKLSNCEAYQSNVNFDVLCHNANTASGSSGGAILDVNLNLVGIHYAGATDKDTGKFIQGYAIPITKVNEFLRKYIWEN